MLVNGAQIKVSSATAGQIQAVLPTGILGLVALKVQNSLGSHTVNVMVEASAPALYASVVNVGNNSKIDGSNPAAAGMTILVYATGLGETTSSSGYDVARAQVAASIGGVAAKVI